MRRVATALIPLIAVLGLVAATPVTAEAALGDQLTVTPNYDGNVGLATDSFEDRDGLPQYSLSLTDVASGANVPLSTGYATRTSGSNYESNYSATTTAPLTVGTLYQAIFTLRTVGHYTCSIYSQQGCYWVDPSNEVRAWRFSWSGAKTIASPYALPGAAGAPSTATSVSVTSRKKFGSTGWRIAGSLMRDGKPIPYLNVFGQLKLRGSSKWKLDDAFSSNASGGFRAKILGKPRGAKYRFLFRGDPALGLSAAYSKTFGVGRS